MISPKRFLIALRLHNFVRIAFRSHPSNAVPNRSPCLIRLESILRAIR